MADELHAVTDPAHRARLAEIRQRLTEGIAAIDPHGRLAGRPTSYRVISGQTLEVVYHEVPSIDEAQVLGVKRLIGDQCYCRVTPRSAETLDVRFVIPLTPG